jgi:hypothetical protein
MTVIEIYKKIFLDTWNIKYDSACWFEMYLCETKETKNGSKYDTKTFIQYYTLDILDNKLLLLNKRGKVIKELSKENTVWISGVFLCDRHIRVLVSDLDFAEIETEVIKYDR